MAQLTEINKKRPLAFAFDIALKAAVYIKEEGAPIEVQSEFFFGHINNLKRFIRDYYIDKQKAGYKQFELYFYKDGFKNHHTTAVLARYKGQIEQIFIEYAEVNNSFNSHWYFENAVSYKVYNKYLKRDQKKVEALKLYNKHHPTKTENDDLAEAFVLYYYVNHVK